MKPVLECPNAEALQQMLLGLGDGSIDAHLERHLDECPHCAERMARIAAEDDVVRAMRRAGNAETSVPNPTPAVVDALVSVLRRVKVMPQASGDTGTWNGEKKNAGSTISFGGPQSVGFAPRQPGDPRPFGGYLLHEMLGAGGMGVVHRGFDTRLQRDVAVKMIRPDLVSSDGQVERFIAEARNAAAVEHDHIVAVYSVEVHDGVPCLVMPLLKGRTLEQAFRDAPGPWPLPELLRIAREATAGLVAAHARGLVHRDIKPANLWLEAPSGRLKILDFGLAVAVGADNAAVVGTPGYMSPEQIRGQPIDVRADLFSLGCVLYRAATGQAPFPGRTAIGAMVNTLTQEHTPTATLALHLPRDLVLLIDRMLAAKPEDRPESAAAIADSLAAMEAEMVEQHRRTARRRWLVGVVSAGAAGGLGAWLWKRPGTTVVEVPQPEADPVVVAFDTDPEIESVEFTRDGETAVRNLKSDNGLSLKPGSYALRSAVEVPGRSLMPASIVVAPGEPQRVKLALVGEVAKSRIHSGAVTGLVVVPFGDRFTVVSASKDRTLNEWQPKTRQQRHADLTSPAKSFAATPDGAVVATAGGNAQEPLELGIQLWDGRTLQPRGEPLDGHTRFIGVLALSPNGAHLLSATRDEVWLWNVEKRTNRILNGHGGAKVSAAAFDTEGKQLLTADEAGTLVLWSVDKGTSMKELNASRSAVNAVAFMPGGWLATGADGVVRVWDARSFQVREVAKTQKPVRAVAVSKDGRRLLTGGEDRTVKLWNLGNGELQYAFAGHEEAVNAVAFTPDGRECVSGGDDRTIRICRLPFE